MLGCRAPVGRALCAPRTAVVSLRRAAPPGRRPLIVRAKAEKKKKKDKQVDDSDDSDSEAVTSAAPTADAAPPAGAPKSDNGKGAKEKGADASNNSPAKASFDPKRW